MDVGALVVTRRESGERLGTFYMEVAGVCVFFFFQAEDGIRDDLVTGVQTCALPIYSFAMPKSTSTAASPDAGTMMLDGLISRCKTGGCWQCKKCTASMTGTRVNKTRGKEKRFPGCCWRKASRFGPSM